MNLSGHFERKMTRIGTWIDTHLTESHLADISEVTIGPVTLFSFAVT